MSSGLGTDATDAWLELVTPDGDHDVWGVNNAARAMQGISDGDFQIETRFLSTPSEKYQLQGLLVEQDADNWLRFDTYSDGKKLYAFAAITVDGVSSMAFRVRIPSDTAPYLRLTRAGDDWTLDYSTDGTTWVTAGSFTHALTASQVGVFGGNTGLTTGFTAQVDYFETSDDPILDEDGTIVPVGNAPDAVDDGLVTDQDVALVISVASDILVNDSDPNGDPISVTGMTQPANGTLVDNADGTWTYTPNAGFGGADSFTYTISDGGLTDTATVNLTVNDTTPANDAPDAVDDGLVTDQDVALVISVASDILINDSDPNGDPISVTGMTQPANGTLVDNADGTWTYTPNAGFGGADSFTYTISDGGLTDIATVNLTVNVGGFPATVYNAPGVQEFDGTAGGVVEIAHDAAFETPEGTVAFSFIATDTSGAQGLFAKDASGYVGGGHHLVMFLKGSTLKVRVQDADSEVYLNYGGITVGQEYEVALTFGADGAELWIDGALVASDPLVMDWTQNTQVIQWGGRGWGSADGQLGFDAPFEGTIADAQIYSAVLSPPQITTLAATSSTTTPPSSGIASDDFSGGVLDPVWTIEGPGGISSGLGTDATDAWLELVTPDGDHDVWGVNNAARAMQGISDGDFQIETRFLSTPSEKYQLQGLLVEQDADNWLRFDTYSDGSQLYAFAAITVDGVSSMAFRVTIPGSVAPYLRLTRAGDDWTLDYSTDGTTWVTAGSFTHALTASQVGVFGGNTGLTTGFTAQVDYFETSDDPILDEDGTIVPVGNAPDAVDDGLATDQDVALEINVAADLLTNDSDPNGDPISVTGMTQPANGTLVDNADGTWTYTPDAGFDGADSFTYTISDGSLTDTATVNLTVNDTTPANDAPDAINDSYELDTSGAVVVSAADGVLRNDTDPDGDLLTLTLATGPANGALTLNPDGGFTYTADPGYTGPDSFTYTITDPSGESDTAAVVLNSANTAPVINTGTSRFSKSVVSTEMPLTHIALAADFDQDGDLDIVSTSELDDTVAWFENDGAGGFIRHDIDTVLESAYSASVADLDQDGDMDVLAGGYREDLHVWYENDGSGSFTRHDIVAEDGPHSIFAVDMDEDGDLDLVTSGQDANTIAWRENDGSQNFTTHLVDVASLAAKSAVPVDLDGDGDVDIVAASFTDDTIAWYENDGSENFIKHVLDTGANGAYFATAADIDGDGDLDIVSASKNDDTIAWYRNDAGSFTKSLISANADAARFVSTADIDRDGDIDVLSASVDDNTVAVYLNDGAGAFTTVIADSAAIGAYGAEPVDMNGDGLPDILSVSKTDGTVAILFQEKAHEVTLSPGDSLAIDTALLSSSDVEQAAADLTYTIGSIPLMGELRLDGVALGVGASFTQEDVDLGRVSYHQSGAVVGTDGFTLSLSDGFAAAATISFDLTIETPSTPSGIASDDFSGGVLDPVWTIEGPGGISSGLGTDATDAWLELVTPDGAHDVWGVNNGARAMQGISDGDFQIETRFLSTPSEKYQLQGLLVEQDADNWLRFDTYSDGKKLYAFAAITVDGVSSMAFRVTIPGSVAPYLRLTRAGDDWTLDYSTDGTAWVTAGSFTHALTAAKAGVFGGNTGSATGFTAQVDYFETSDDPILDEDGTIVPVNNAPDAVDDGLATDQDVALEINVAADLLTNDSDPNGDPISVTGMTQPANGTLVDNADGTWTYTPNAGFGGADSFTYTISDGSLTDTATVNLTVGNPIDVWYGLDQSFGSPGESQEWINILGNVSGAVTSLTYSLNGGPSRALSIGEDTRRLQNPGDFNIDVSYSELDGSAADDVITITATFADSSVHTRDVTVQYGSGTAWDPNYSIDWETVTDLQDVVQVVDGLWSWDGTGARPVELGYDRLLVIGDQGWDNYEVNLTITMHDLTNVDPRGRDGGGLALGMLWDGHTDEPITNWQPKSGWEPGAMFFWEDGTLKSRSYHSFSEVLGSVGSLPLQEGLSYNYTLRVEQVGIYDRQYSLKVWEEGTSEPVDWTLQTIETFSLTEAPATGSIYLNAHYYDVTFGDLTVTEITGSDIIQGTDAADVLMAADPGGASPGADEIDVFTGMAGADTFVFGDTGGTYYDDGLAAASGEADYGFIWDFVSGTDQIQLAGAATDYLLTTDAPGLTPGTAIWWAGQGGDVDELIGIVNGVYALDLNSSDFTYTGLAFV
ncbi:Ig-like domain-containing protein [Aliiroseovarius sp. N1Y82]|nr:Ig-like domain-containing protein [Aliiroseovarius subalbicans]